MVRVLLLALVAAATWRLGLAQSKRPQSALDKATLEAYLRHQFMLPENLKMLIADPRPSTVPGLLSVQVTVSDGERAQQRVEFLVSQDGAKLLQAKVFDIRESPFAEELRLLKLEGHPSLGQANAVVTIAIFSDFQCQYCREEAKTLRQHLLASYPSEVRLVFKDYPLEAIHPWAKRASMIGRCVFRQQAAKFWEFHDWIFEQQASLTADNLDAKALAFAGEKGLDALQLKQCIDAKLTAGDVEASMTEGRALQVNSTPTLFVNGRRLVGNVAWEQLKKVIDYEIGYAKRAAAKAKEPCCEVSLPIPAAK